MLSFLKAKFSRAPPPDTPETAEAPEALEVPQAPELEDEGPSSPSPVPQMKRERISHFGLVALCGLLIVFSLSSGIALMTVSSKNSGITQAKVVTTFLLILGGVISMVAGAAMLMSWRKITWFLHIYEFACLVVLVSLVLILMSIGMMTSKISNSSDPVSMLSACNNPNNYFEY
jgi:hypothetical protein